MKMPCSVTDKPEPKEYRDWELQALEDEANEQLDQIVDRTLMDEELLTEVEAGHELFFTYEHVQMFKNLATAKQAISDMSMLLSFYELGKMDQAKRYYEKYRQERPSLEMLVSQVEDMARKVRAAIEKVEWEDCWLKAQDRLADREPF